MPVEKSALDREVDSIDDRIEKAEPEERQRLILKREQLHERQHKKAMARIARMKK